MSRSALEVMLAALDAYHEALKVEVRAAEVELARLQAKEEMLHVLRLRLQNGMVVLEAKP